MEAQRYTATLKGTQLVIDLPASFADCRVEVIVLALEPAPHRRKPPASLAGKMTYDDDLLDSAPASEWEGEIVGRHRSKSRRIPRSVALAFRRSRRLTPAS